MKRFLTTTALSLGSVLLLAVTVKAAVITGAAVTSSTAGDFYPASNLSDLSSLSGDPNASGTVDDGSASWATDNPSGSYYYSTLPPAPVLTFDLGTDSDLAGFYYWAYNIPGNNAKDVSLTFATSANPTNFTAPINFTLDPTNFDALATPITIGSQPRQAFNFGGPITARYVQVTISDNYYNDYGGDFGGDRVGMSKLLFNNTTPVPFEMHPTLGLLVIGGIWSSRRWLKQRNHASKDLLV